MHVLYVVVLVSLQKIPSLLLPLECPLRRPRRRCRRHRLLLWSSRFCYCCLFKWTLIALELGGCRGAWRRVTGLFGILFWIRKELFPGLLSLFSWLFFALDTFGVLCVGYYICLLLFKFIGSIILHQHQLCVKIWQVNSHVTNFM
jgi:hypothetical protein